MSKTSVALAGIVILSAGILAAWSVPQAEDPAVLLRAAIEKEEVDGDLAPAIEQYKHVIKIAGANRAVAAQALLRLGGCVSPHDAVSFVTVPLVLLLVALIACAVPARRAARVDPQRVLRAG